MKYKRAIHSRSGIRGLVDKQCSGITLLFTHKGSSKEGAMRILVYYDGTEESREAIPIAKMHSKAFNATVDVVSSLPSGREERLDEISRMESELDYVRSVFEREKIPCETHLLIRGNDPGADIVQFAGEHGVDEIIIGAEKKTKVEKLLLGSVAQHVILNTNRPVLVV